VPEGDYLLFLNAHTGQLLTSVDLGGQTQAAASIARGEIFVGLRDGTLLALDLPVVSSATPILSSGSAPLDVTFNVAASGGLPPYEYAWTFGDGNRSAVRSPAHEYLRVGTYVVQVTVTDQSGDTSTNVLSVTVSAVSTHPGPSDLVEILAIVVGIALVVGVYLILVRLRRRPPSGAEPAASPPAPGPPASASPEDSPSPLAPSPPNVGG
jgi:PKD repeat protein